MVLDLDSLDNQAAASSSSIATTPTGIVHSTPLGTLLASTPHRLVALTNSTADAASLKLEKLGLSTTTHALTLLTPDVLTRIQRTRAHWPRVAAALGLDGGNSNDGPTRKLLVVSADEATRTATSATRGLGLEKGVVQASVVAPLVGPTCAVDRAMLCTLGCCSARTDDGPSRIAYLSAKRPIDAAAYSKAVGSALEAALVKQHPSYAYQRDPKTEALRVFDLGAGTLSMLPVIVAAAAKAGWSRLEYCAFDSDRCLLDAASNALIASGDGAAARIDNSTHTQAVRDKMVLEGGDGSLQPSHVLTVTYRNISPLVVAKVHLYVADVLELESHLTDSSSDEADAFPPCHLLVGSGFADLLPPEQMSTLLPRLCPGGLVYLPSPLAVPHASSLWELVMRRYLQTSM